MQFQLFWLIFILFTVLHFVRDVSGYSKRKCSREKNVFKMANRWIETNIKAFNENRMSDTVGLSEDTVQLPNNFPPIIGRTAILAWRQQLRNGIADRVEITLVEATQVSCTRIIIRERIEFLKGDTVVFAIRGLAVYKLQRGEWVGDILMDNQGA